MSQLTNGIAFLLKKNGVDVYQGYGEIVNPTKVKVGEQELDTKHIIIATGSSAIIPPIPGAKEAFESKHLLTSKEILQLKTFPKSLTIVGGGVIGIEFASIFNSLGTKVTIIERLPSILTSIDGEVVKAYQRKLKKDKIDVLTNATVTNIKDNIVTYEYNNESKTLESELILMAVGTKANAEAFKDLVQLEGSNIITNEYLQTNIKNIYAIGDVNGKFMLAHVASHEGIIAVNHILGKNPKPMDYSKIPSCIYGSIEIAGIGLTEQQAKEKNIDYKVSKVPVGSIGKALADGEREGFIKLITETTYQEVLGVWIYAYQATELISEFSLAMTSEATAHEIIEAIHPHPTLSELSLEAALAAVDKAIHS